MNTSQKPGLYLHIPFCKSKCGYCDFYSTTNSEYRSAFLNALLKEINIYAQKYSKESRFDTVYLGGGTPSLLTSQELSEIFNALIKNFSISQDVEITIEINPDTVDRIKLIKYINLGINRISVGVQSFNNKELKLLGRAHTVKQSLTCLRLLQDVGFNNFNIDLIYALPNQNICSWTYTLEKAVSYKPAHISTYNLTFEKGTPYYMALKTGKLNVLSEDKEIILYQLTHDYLLSNGYIHYEISNYAKSHQKISRHNYKYWDHAPYIGLGPSAHSFWSKKRWGNRKSIRSYILELKLNKLPIEFTEFLMDKDVLFEYIFLKLRTYQGINLVNFKKDFGRDFVQLHRNNVQQLLKQNLAVINDGFFRLSDKGMLLCDEILPSFVS